MVLFVAVGARSNRNRSPLSPKTGLPGSGWIVEEEFPLTLEPGSQSASGSTLRSGSNRVLSYHWRQGAAGWLAEALRAFFALDRSPLRRPEEILVVRIGTGLGAALPREKSAAEQTLLSFYHLLRPLLDGLELKLGKSFSRFS